MRAVEVPGNFVSVTPKHIEIGHECPDWRTRNPQARVGTTAVPGVFHIDVLLDEAPSSRSLRRCEVAIIHLSTGYAEFYRRCVAAPSRAHFTPDWAVPRLAHGPHSAMYRVA